MNTKVLFSALCLLVSISVCAKSDGEATIATSLEADVKPELPVLAPDSMPEFPGGVSAMMTYLMDNVKYPADAKKDKKTNLLKKLQECKDNVFEGKVWPVK